MVVDDFPMLTVEQGKSLCADAIGCMQSNHGCVYTTLLECGTIAIRRYDDRLIASFWDDKRSRHTRETYNATANVIGTLEQITKVFYDHTRAAPHVYDSDW